MNNGRLGDGPGPDVAFPETNWSEIRDASQRDPARASRALASLCASYLQPAQRWLLTAGVPPQHAEDVTHDLFEQWLGRGRLPGCQAQSGRFRRYLIASLRNLLRDQHTAAHRAKRGGGAAHVSLEETVLAIAPDASLDRQLDMEFARSIHERALIAVAGRWAGPDRQRKFEHLQRFALHCAVDGEYRRAAEVLNLNPTQVKRAVFDLREDYFTAFRAEVIRLTVPEEVPDEIRYLVGLLAEGLS